MRQADSTALLNLNDLLPADDFEQALVEVDGVSFGHGRVRGGRVVDVSPPRRSSVPPPTPPRRSLFEDIPRQSTPSLAPIMSPVSTFSLAPIGASDPLLDEIRAGFFTRVFAAIRRLFR